MRAAMRASVASAAVLTTVLVGAGTANAASPSVLPSTGWVVVSGGSGSGNSADCDMDNPAAATNPACPQLLGGLPNSLMSGGSGSSGATSGSGATTSTTQSTGSTATTSPATTGTTGGAASSQGTLTALLAALVAFLQAVLAALGG